MSLLCWYCTEMVERIKLFWHWGLPVVNPTSCYKTVWVLLSVMVFPSDAKLCWCFDFWLFHHTMNRAVSIIWPSQIDHVEHNHKPAFIYSMLYCLSVRAESLVNICHMQSAEVLFKHTHTDTHGLHRQKRQIDRLSLSSMSELVSVQSDSGRADPPSCTMVVFLAYGLHVLSASHQRWYTDKPSQWMDEHTHNKHLCVCRCCLIISCWNYCWLFCFSFWMFQQPDSYLRWLLRAVLGKWLLYGQHWCFTIYWKMRSKSDLTTRSMAQQVSCWLHVLANGNLPADND